MQQNEILRVVYTFFLGVLLAIFVGVGINTFYPGPESPDCYQTVYQTSEKMPSETQLAQERACQALERAYQEKFEPYSRNVSIIALVSAVVFLAVSLVFEKRIKVIADGVLLGGLFTLLYSVIRGFMADDSKYVFAVVTVGLAVVLYLGYHRFVPQQSKKTVVKSKVKEPEL